MEKEEKSKTKIEFIKDLLSEKRIDNSSKEKLFNLVAKELQHYDKNVDSIHSELEEIKKKIGLGTTKSPPPFIVEYIDPSLTSQFLIEYNQDPILKSTTHLIDTNLLKTIIEYLNIKFYNFESHLNAINSSYKKLTNKYYNKIPKGVYAKIHAYLDNATWSENNISISWGNKDIKEWSASNPGLCPNPDVDLKQEPYKFKPKNISDKIWLKNMCDVVLFFKKQFTIRPDNNLQDLCNEWSFDYLDKATIDNSNIYIYIEFFTDVEKIGQAYKKIIELCLESNLSNKPIIKNNLTYNAETNEIIFSIHHVNSTFNKNLDQTRKRYGRTFTDLITNQINGLCNWKLKADFRDNVFAELNLWPNDGEFKKIEKFEGVQFELIFKYI
jgi:hypothetical protein